MKIRTFRHMDDGVFRVIVFTEDWSQGDLKLMAQFGEPEINVGGTIPSGPVFGDEYVRVLHGFPYSRGFDSRDYEDQSVDLAVAAGVAWKNEIVSRIEEAITKLRTHVTPLPTEEIDEF